MDSQPYVSMTNARGDISLRTGYVKREADFQFHEFPETIVENYADNNWPSGRFEGYPLKGPVDEKWTIKYL